MTSVESMVQAGDWRGLGRWLGFESRPVRISSGGLAGWSLGVLEGHSVTVMTSLGARLVVVAGGPSHRSRRVAMREVHRRNPLDVTLWMWVSEEVLEVTFGVERSDGGFDVRRMVLARDCPELEGLRQLEGLRISGLVSPDERERGRAVRRHFEETLDRETITRSFFSGFRQALNLLDTSLVNGPKEAEQRHSVCLNTLLRVLFLYFLQSRSALNNDRRFILRAWRGRDRDGSFYRKVLRPLFFGALNTPLDQRDEHITKLGLVPFLNGGLFDPTPIEEHYPSLDWPDETWCHVLENLMERYHFEVGEDDPSHNCSIDPEMLGKVFEGLMFGDARAKSGSFYTPVDVVRSMVRQGLESHLCQSLGWSPEKAAQLWASTTVDLDTRDQLRQAFTNFRVLDPAAGTGAFLLETLQHLKHLWTLVDGQVDHVRLRTLVHDHLYGVDINYTATRLCELRIWIALLAATPQYAVPNMPPLPNLTHRIVTGDALIEPFDLVSRRTRAGVMANSSVLRSDHADRLAQLQRTYLNCHGRQKAQVRAALDAAEKASAVHVLETRLRRLRADAEHLELHATETDMFGHVRANRSATRALSDVEQQYQAVQRIMEAQSGEHQAFSMTWAAKFPEVMRDGGFHLIVTNPPWVRAHAVDRAKSALLTSRYASCTNGIWTSAKRRGIRAPFGAQVDLANIFLERSIELLRRDGHLIALVPSKMFRSLQGAGVRRVLGRHDVMSIEDFSESSRSMFDATTYPACIHVRRSSSKMPSVVKVWSKDTRECWAQRLPTDGSPWVLVPPDILAILSAMQRRSDAHFDPVRGIFTGANDLFVGTKDELLRKLALVDDSLIRPVLKGADLHGEHQSIFWPYDDHGEALVVPPPTRDYFAHHRTRLEARKDHDPNQPLWQVFRRRCDAANTKVVWGDISKDLAPIIAPAGSVALNTVYYLPCQDDAHARSLQQLLSSTPIRACARMYSERARGGYRRHFAWCIRMLPVTQKLLAMAEGGQFIDDAVVANALGLDHSALELLRRWMDVADRSTGMAA